MKEQSLNEENHPSDGDIISQLLIYAESDGQIFFSCDWEKSPEAAATLGTILYRLSDGNLVDEIINSLESQCVLEGRESDFNNINLLITSLRSLKQSSDPSEQDVVVSPIDATTFN